MLFLLQNYIMDKIKMIKPDAIIDIKIGTGFLQQIQHLLMFLAKDLKPEQLEQYKKEADEKITFTEEWMSHVTTVSILLKERGGLDYKNDEILIAGGARPVIYSIFKVNFKCKGLKTFHIDYIICHILSFIILVLS